MAEAAQKSLYDDENDEVTGVRNKSRLNIMEILYKMDEGLYQEDEDMLRRLSEKNKQLDLFEQIKEDDEEEGELRLMVALLNLPKEELKKLAESKHAIGFHGGISKILEDLLRLTGDPKFNMSQV